MKHAILFFLLLLAVTASGQGGIWEGGKQQLMQARTSDKTSKVKQWKNHIQQWGLDTAYTHSLALSARLHTNGWSGGVIYIHQKTPGVKTLWSLHLAEIKHEKEVRQQQSKGYYAELGKNTPFIFGKINNAYTLQVGYGREQTLLPALLDGNMSVAMRYSAGPSLVMMKPVYLNLIYTDFTPDPHSRVASEKYTPSNADRYLTQHAILGGDKWSKGIGEIKYIPGLFAELAFVLEADKPKSFIKAVTIGANIAYYASPVEIMAERVAHRHQACFFVGIALGKRWGE